VHSAGSPQSQRDRIGPAGAEGLAGVLARCTALDHLNLGHNQIGPAGAEFLAGVLANTGEVHSAGSPRSQLAMGLALEVQVGLQT